MTSAAAVDAVRFGRTTICSAVGTVFDQEVEAVVVASTGRGLLGTGVAALLRDRGAGQIERLAMAAAPLELGGVLVTAAPGLEEQGIRVVIHAVIHPALGDVARPENVGRALAATMAEVERCRCRSLALPLLGVAGGSVDPPEVEPAIGLIVDELVGCLRRGEARPTRVVVVARSAELAALVDDAIERARRRVWTLRR